MNTYELEVNGKILSVILAKNDRSAKIQASKALFKYTGFYYFGRLYCRNDNMRHVGSYSAIGYHWI